MPVTAEEGLRVTRYSPRISYLPISQTSFALWIYYCPISSVLIRRLILLKDFFLITSLLLVRIYTLVWYLIFAVTILSWTSSGHYCWCSWEWWTGWRHFYCNNDSLRWIPKIHWWFSLCIETGCIWCSEDQAWCRTHVFSVWQTWQQHQWILCLQLYADDKYWHCVSGFRDALEAFYLLPSVDYYPVLGSEASRLSAHTSIMPIVRICGGSNRSDHFHRCCVENVRCSNCGSLAWQCYWLHLVRR